MVEQCYRTTKTLVNPIVDWSTADVWEFLNEVAKVPHCELYDQGFARLGCVGCPISANAAKELERWPTYRRAYIKAFDRMIKEHERKGLKTKWVNGDNVMGLLSLCFTVSINASTALYISLLSISASRLSLS